MVSPAVRDRAEATSRRAAARCSCKTRLCERSRTRTAVGSIRQSFGKAGRKKPTNQAKIISCYLHRTWTVPDGGAKSARDKLRVSRFQTQASAIAHANRVSSATSHNFSRKQVPSLYRVRVPVGPARIADVPWRRGALSCRFQRRLSQQENVWDVRRRHGRLRQRHLLKQTESFRDSWYLKRDGNTH